MCTYQTTSLTVRGSGKGAQGWFALTDATVYFDHPVHAGDGHTLNIDLRNPDRGPGYRVAVELDAASARALAQAILQTLDDTPAALRHEDRPREVDGRPRGAVEPSASPASSAAF
ncbi:MAG: DUF6295 family protein [Acidimicrobiales bacterium]|jgi:hypothetical protein